MRISDWSSDVCSSDLYGPSASPVLAMRLAMRALGEPPFAFPYSFPYRTDRAVEARLHPPQDIGAQGIGRIGLVCFQKGGLGYENGRAACGEEVGHKV